MVKTIIKDLSQSNKLILSYSYPTSFGNLSAEDVLKSAVTEEKKFKHSPWAGADNPLGPKFLCQQEGLITMVICCKFKKESLQPLTLYSSFHDLINVY